MIFIDFHVFRFFEIFAGPKIMFRLRKSKNRKIEKTGFFTRFGQTLRFSEFSAFQHPPTPENSKNRNFSRFSDFFAEKSIFRFLGWHRVEKVGFRTKNHEISLCNFFLRVLGKLFRGSKFSTFGPVFPRINSRFASKR